MNRTIATSLGILLMSSVAGLPALAQEKMLRIGMTAADIPRTLGQPDQGFEGNRFTGIPIYDSLTQWDLSKEKEPSVLIPGLATELDGRRERQDQMGVQASARREIPRRLGCSTPMRSSGTCRRCSTRAAPHFDPSQVGVTASRMPTLRSARKIDDVTVELTTSEPDSFLPINLTNLFMASPAHWEAKLKAVPASVTDAAERAKQAWAAFAADPSGSGPVPGDALRARASASSSPRTRPIGTRSAGRRSTASCCCRCPRRTRARPRCCPARSTGSRRPRPTPCRRSSNAASCVYQNAQPHVWPWQLSFAEGSPWLDRRVRQAANLCINRSELKELLGGMMAEPKGTGRPGHPWWGNPKFEIKYDPAAAKKLMGEAGFSAAKPLKVKVQTSASGSGQMQPIPMNEFVQQNLKRLLLRRRARRHRVEHAVHQLAPRRQGRVGARRQRDQRHLRGDGPVLRHGALRLDQDVPAGVEQLGLSSATRSSTS